MNGTILWFNVREDHGVLTTEAGERVEVRGDAFADGVRPTGRSAGTIVQFRVVDGPSGRTATEVVFVPYSEPRRARLRHGRR